MPDPETKSPTGKLSDHDLLLSIADSMRRLLDIQDQRLDETFYNNSATIAAGASLQFDASVIPIRFMVNVPRTSAANSVADIFEGRYTINPGLGSAWIASLTPGDGVHWTPHDKVITIFNTGSATVTVFIAALGDGEYKSY